MITSTLAPPWRIVKVDSNVTVMMPGEVSNTAYKNQQIISSQSDSANLFLSYEKNRIKLHFKDKVELEEGYDQLIAGYLKAFKNAEVLTTEGLRIGNLIAKKVEFQADFNEARRNIFAAFVIVDNITYVFQVLTEYSLDELKDLSRFIQSVDFKSSLTMKNQID